MASAHNSIWQLLDSGLTHAITLPLFIRDQHKHGVAPVVWHSVCTSVLCQLGRRYMGKLGAPLVMMGILFGCNEENSSILRRMKSAATDAGLYTALLVLNPYRSMYGSTFFLTMLATAMVSYRTQFAETLPPVVPEAAAAVQAPVTTTTTTTAATASSATITRPAATTTTATTTTAAMTTTPVTITAGATTMTFIFARPAPLASLTTTTTSSSVTTTATAITMATMLSSTARTASVSTRTTSTSTSSFSSSSSSSSSSSVLSSNPQLLVEGADDEEDEPVEGAEPLEPERATTKLTYTAYAAHAGTIREAGNKQRKFSRRIRVYTGKVNEKLQRFTQPCARLISSGSARVSAFYTACAARVPTRVSNATGKCTGLITPHFGEIRGRVGRVMAFLANPVAAQGQAAPVAASSVPSVGNISSSSSVASSS